MDAEEKAPGRAASVNEVSQLREQLRTTGHKTTNRLGVVKLSPELLHAALKLPAAVSIVDTRRAFQSFEFLVEGPELAEVAEGNIAPDVAFETMAGISPAQTLDLVMARLREKAIHSVRCGPSYDVKDKPAILLEYVERVIDDLRASLGVANQ